jgi:hypothetical protein
MSTTVRSIKNRRREAERRALELEAKILEWAWRIDDYYGSSSVENVPTIVARDMRAVVGRAVAERGEGEVSGAGIAIKPRLPFCWWCSRKFHGNFHRVVILDGMRREVHADCARKLSDWMRAEIVPGASRKDGRPER